VPKAIVLALSSAVGTAKVIVTWADVPVSVGPAHPGRALRQEARTAAAATTTDPSAAAATAAVVTAPAAAPANATGAALATKPKRTRRAS
jgi:hypothetical protein